MKISFVKKKAMPLKPSKSRELMESHARSFWRICNDMQRPFTIESINERIQFWMGMNPPPNIKRRLEELQTRNENRRL